MKLYSAAIASSILLSSSIAAHAGTVCSEKTHTKYGETRIYSKDYIATCRPNGSCAAVTYKMNKGTLEKDAPLGWDHRMSISRFSKGGPWEITFTAVTVVPDLSQSIRLIVDKNNSHKIMSAFLRQKQAINEISIDTKLSDIILKKLKKGSNVRWEYTVKGAEKGQEGATVFSLVGLTKALKWADCAQRLGGF